MKNLNITRKVIIWNNCPPARLRPAPVVGHSPPSLAKILSGPPVPWVIFIGRANTVAPLDGNLSRLAKFTYPGMFALNNVLRDWKFFDSP